MKKSYVFFLSASLFSLTLFFTACSKDPTTTEPEPMEDPIRDTPTRPFAIEGAAITFEGVPITYNGVNALQTFGLGDPDLMNEWNVEIVREFIGNLREQPLTGGPILASNNVWYHPLQAIVDQNRANGKITILCPFGWVNENGERQLLTGLNPKDQSFYEDYKIKMRSIAQQFKDQPDVWIETWNEPFHWNRENGYSDEMWLDTQAELVDNLRSVEGFKNIIVVQGSEQGQAESVVLNKGKDLLEDRYNLLFDFHAYEKWLIGTTQEEISTRFTALRNAGFAFVIGEVGVENASGLMEVEHFLDAAKQNEASVMAWLWNKNSGDVNALMDDDGNPNENGNNNWGSVFRSYILN